MGNLVFQISQNICLIQQHKPVPGVHVCMRLSLLLSAAIGYWLNLAVHMLESCHCFWHSKTSPNKDCSVVERCFNFLRVCCSPHLLLHLCSLNISIRTSGVMQNEKAKSDKQCLFLCLQHAQNLVPGAMI